MSTPNPRPRPAALPAPAAAAAPTSGPTALDFLVVFAGFGLSLYLMDLAPLPVEAGPAVTAAPARQAVAFLPRLLRVPEGVLLLAPVLQVARRVTGRARGVTAGEWLALVAWFGTAAVTGLAVWGAVAAPPEAVAWLTPRARVLWYTIVVPSVAAVALALLVLGLVLRRPGPWTQPLYLALLLFPAPFAVGVLVFGEVAA